MLDFYKFHLTSRTLLLQTEHSKFWLIKCGHKPFYWIELQNLIRVRSIQFSNLGFRLINTICFIISKENLINKNMYNLNDYIKDIKRRDESCDLVSIIILRHILWYLNIIDHPTMVTLLLKLIVIKQREFLLAVGYF